MAEGSEGGESRFVDGGDSRRNGEGVLIEISIAAGAREVDEEIRHISDGAGKIVTGDGMPNGC